MYFNFNGNNNQKNFNRLNPNNNDEMFEHWLREISKMLRQDDITEQTRNERFLFNLRQQEGVTLEAFLYQVAITLRDEFLGTVYQDGSSLYVRLADNETFCLQITKKQI